MYLPFILFILYTARTEAVCPDVKTADNLNITAFASGTWSDLARYPNHFETAEECLTLKYSLKGDILRIDSIDVHEDQHNFVDGEGKVQPDGKILFNVSTGYPRQNVQLTLTVLFVDHEKYAVLYDCIHEEDNNTKVSVWITGRTTSIDDADKPKLFEFIKSSNIIDMDKLFWINYSDENCNQQ